MTEKAVLRRDAALRRDAFTGEARKQADEVLLFRLCQVIEGQKPQWVFTFVSCKSEADTHALIRWCLEHQISAAVPRVEGRIMRFYQITSMEQLIPGYKEILEPEPGCPEAVPGPGEHAVMIVPGLLFDERGNRLGYGGGYYDRFLAEHEDMFRIGIGFDLQVAEHVLTEPHDEPLDMVLTETRQIAADRKGRSV